MSSISEHESPFPGFCDANFQIGPSYVYVSKLEIRLDECKSVLSGPVLVYKHYFSPKCSRSILMTLHISFNSASVA